MTQPSVTEIRTLVAERFAEHYRSTPTGASTTRPATIMGVDPDSRATAYCLADLSADSRTYVFRETEGGGNPKAPVRWQSTHGIAELLRMALAEREPHALVVAVETQVLGSAHITDCAELLRWRHVCAALCELRGVHCIEVAPVSWMRAIAPEAFKRGSKTPGLAKKLYQERARAMVGTVAKNEDRCAAVGITAWLAAELGCHFVARPGARHG